MKPTEIESDLLIRHEPPLAWIVINRPAARNALTLAMWEGLAGHVRRLSSDDRIRVIIMTGAGGQAFIAGADIGELRAALESPRPEEQAENEKRAYHFTLDALHSITDSPKPVIAMINGHCMGGGMLLAMSCDLRFAADTARFGIPAAKLGVAYPPREGAARLARIIGATAAADLLLSGRAIDAHEALRIGLVTRILPLPDLESSTREYAFLLAENAPLSHAAHKAALQQMLAPDRNTELVIDDFVARCYESNDCREGLSAFLEKRTPRFEGK